MCSIVIHRKRLRLPLRLASRLRDEDRDPPCGPRLVVRVRRIRRDGELPESRPLGPVLDLADPHRLHRGVIADLDGRIGAQVMPPHGGSTSPRQAPSTLGPVYGRHAAPPRLTVIQCPPCVPIFGTDITRWRYPPSSLIFRMSPATNAARSASVRSAPAIAARGSS